MKAVKQNALTTPGAQNADAAQRRAADPKSSVWVGASAGTGKTKVLVDRLLRLMLPDSTGQTTRPERILCLTFTKTAAAEMAVRVQKDLSRWVSIDEATLVEELTQLIGETPDATQICAARQLFAKIVDVPGGMKIMTLHAFCQAVLKAFPLEAGLPPHFEVMDERTAHEYLLAAQHDLIARADADPQGDLGQALSVMTSLTDSDTLQALLQKITTKRGVFQDILAAHGGVDALITAIYTRLGVKPGETEASLLAAFCQDTTRDEKNILRVCAFLESAKEQKIADKIVPWIQNPETRIANFETYRRGFYTTKDEVFKSFATKATLKKCPDIDDVLRIEAIRIGEFYTRLNAVRIAGMTAALFQLGAEILLLYARHKRERALLDYEDQIEKTATMLSADGMANWVLYKLDGGLDHILVDEAQDTSPAQWQIIRALTDEFFAGAGRHETPLPPSLFVVGDEKQSIFSFQGADPTKFDAMRHYFSQQIQNAKQQWDHVNMHVSFRSTRAVLSLVDDVFSRPDIKAGVVADAAEDIFHTPDRAQDAGCVELWPPVAAVKADPLDPWTVIDTDPGQQDSAVILAQKIARTISGWLKNKEILESTGAAVQPGDILILVRSRNKIAPPLIRALKDAAIPVSGADRIVLAEQIGVMDLLCLARFVLLPEDDLNLATLLKTPLIGWTDAQLESYAPKRGAQSLWQVLQQQAAEDPAMRFLADLPARAEKHSVYDFFAGILKSPCPADAQSAEKAMITRLGFDALDALDEFLNACQNFVQSHTGGLQSFLPWFENGQSDIKRDMEQATQNQVRIMTVHAAKGLQAPIVFLPDTASHAKRSFQPHKDILWPQNPTDVPFWAQGARHGVYNQAKEAVLDKIDEEYRRLLYVALTRAADRLYICGFLNKKQSAPDPGSWYEIVHHSVAKLADQEIEDENGEKILRFSHPQQRPPKARPQAARDSLDIPAVPDWVFAPCPVEDAALSVFRPSHAEEDADIAVLSPLGTDAGQRFRRGLIVHKLLEILPDLPPAAHPDAAARYVAAQGDVLSEVEQLAVISETLAVLNHPEFLDLFGPGSRAEVSVTGQLASQILSGQIDRLVVRDDDVLIVDYKSNRQPPAHESDVAPAYLKQMAAYRQVLRKIYPQHAVKCFLLWTDGPVLMALSDAGLDAHSPDAILV